MGTKIDTIKMITRFLLTDPVLALNIIKPLLYRRALKGHLKRKINGRVNFEFDFSSPQANASYFTQMYYDTYEISVLRLLRQYLKKGYIFVDVGANIGYLSAYGASLVGKSGQVHCFEPVPTYYNSLLQMVHLNPGYQIYPNCFSISDKNSQSEILITGSNMGMNTMLHDLWPNEETVKILPVETKRLDDYLISKGLRNVHLIKIDVEGYEFPVLQGLTGFFDQAHEISPPVFIVEVTPEAYPLLGTDLNQLKDYVLHHGYRAYQIKEPICPIDLSVLTEQTNVLLLPLKN